jgi:L-aminopeptidase/D-esterase-like protein
MNCYSFKGGTGTSSRVVRHASKDYTVGVLVQANFGSRSELSVAGVPVGAELAGDDPMTTTDWFVRDLQGAGTSGAGSVIVVVATDAPLLPGQCKALARRVPLGLARTGTHGGHFSGDIFLAFSTANAGALVSEIPVRDPTDDDYDHMTSIPWGYVEPFFAAVVESVEEAVLNALVVNDDMVGRDGHRSPAMPRDRVVGILRRHGRLTG